MESPGQKRWRQVEAEEKSHIRARRDQRRDPQDPIVGLAISGGGIRSATFALGVLETLKQLGVLQKVDYLSTVSGGGYVGAWLTAGCWRRPGWLKPTTSWLAAIAHLRRYSNYLSPSVGFLSADTWTMVTIWLRNTLLIQSTVILGLACVLLVPRPLFALFQRWPEMGNWRWASILLFILGIVGIAGNQMRLTSGTVWLLRGRNWRMGLVFAGLCAVAAWLYASAMAFDPFHGGEVSISASLPVAGLLVVAGFILQPVAVRMVGIVWPLLFDKESTPEQINYTQNWVQIAVVVPLMLAGYLVAAVLWGQAIGTPGVARLAATASYGELVASAWRYWPFPLSVVFVSFWLLSFWGIESRRNWRYLATAVWAPMVAVTVLHLLLCAVMLLLHGWAASPVANAAKAFVWAPPLVALSFMLSIIVLIGMIGNRSSDDVREWWSRLSGWLGIYATAWMLIALSAVYGPAVVRWVTHADSWTALTASGGWLGTVIGGLLAANSSSTEGVEKKSSLTTVKEIAARIAPLVFIAGLLVGTAYVLEVIVQLNTTGLNWQANGQGSWNAPAGFVLVSLAALVGCAAVLLLMAARVDINLFSLNSFYRNRLVRCYLGATRDERHPQNFTGFDDDDDIKLADLAGNEQHPFHGPLHLVNCALNLGGSSDLALHTRHSAAFVMSPLYCGSAYESRDQSGKTEELGYIATREYGGKVGAPTLGQAIAVSGAAASPNMGYHTSPVTAFLLTLFNVRLGWWFPNPVKTGAESASPPFSLRFLLAELFGGATDTSTFVMISDGGHFENLAAYELVRRKAGLVIIVDGECDPKLTFEGLGTLIRMSEVDFGARITVDVKSIRTGASGGWSEVRYAEGTIDYGPGIEGGTLIYLKASMTGREDTSVLQYKASHPAFPHESTSDQFYHEDQFESYRRLGRDVAAEAFGALGLTSRQVATLLAAEREAAQT